MKRQYYLEEEKLITSTFKKSLAKENFSIKVSEAEIIKKKYSLVQAITCLLR